MVGRRSRQGGVTYLWLLFLVFVMGLGLGKGLDVYAVTLQRQKEQELLSVGDIYREAIKNYYLSTPSGQRKFPESLADLVQDKRYISTRRYLRRLYPDPLTGKPFVAVPAPMGGIWGVVSPSSEAPVKIQGFSEKYAHFANAASYQDWVFAYQGQGI